MNEIEYFKAAEDIKNLCERNAFNYRVDDIHYTIGVCSCLTNTWYYFSTIVECKSFLEGYAACKDEHGINYTKVKEKIEEDNSTDINQWYHRFRNMDLQY